MTENQPLRLTGDNTRRGSKVESNVVPDTGLLVAIAEVRQQEALMLNDLSTAQWDSTTLCAGWRVREVVAHQTMFFRYTGGRIAVELVKSMGRFNAMADRIAKRDAAQLSIEDQLTCLMENVSNPWRPPGGGLQGALCHDVIHGLDISTALGVELPIAPEHVRLAIDQVTSRKKNPFGTDLDGVELHAEDCDWASGSGNRLYGPARDLLLVYCGRKIPSGRLRGEFAHKFTTGGHNGQR